MVPIKWLERFLFIRTRHTIPDGRPLYAYKCTNKDYNDLKLIVSDEFNQHTSPSYSIIFPLFFCIYAAETWRRNHIGGPWKWETVFAEVSYSVPDHPQIARWVREGLRYWRRPILKSGLGHNEYLITIACEGGLPLLLLQKENASLYRYFKILLEAYHRERNSPLCDPERIARRVSNYLPKGLRHDIVFTLGGLLIKKVVDLQEAVIDAVDPIKALNQKDENWRNELPLPIEDSTAALLLKNLVNEARTLSVTESQRVRWRRRLVWLNGNATIEQQLELPMSFSGLALQRLCNRSELPLRMRLIAQFARAIEPVALITRLRGEGESAIYRCELLKRGGLRLAGKSGLTEVLLFISDGDSETALKSEGDTNWGPLPWVFVERSGQMECIGEGSVRCKDEILMILLPSGGRVVAEEGSAAFIDEITELNRELWQCKGTIYWKHDDLGVCRIRSANPDATDIQYILDGNKIKGTAETTPPFLGVPNLYSLNQNGIYRICEEAVPEWRPVKAGVKGWRRDLKHCVGEVWLRWANTEGEQILCRKIRVVPSEAKIDITSVGVGKTIGKIQLKWFLGAVVNVDRTYEIKSAHHQGDDLIELNCHGRDGLPITQFPAQLFWSDGRQLEMQLPYPREGAAFVYADKVLSPGARVPIAKLATIQAIGQAPSSIGRFYLKVSIKTDSSLFRDLSIRNSLSYNENGRSIFQMHRLQERIDSILSLTGELDSLAFLEITDHSNRQMAHLEVGQFDMILTADWDRNRLKLPETHAKHLEDGWEVRVKLKMVKLWAPADEPVVLKNGETATEWLIPEGLAPGPWWILGEDGDWARFRPLLWVVPGETEQGDSPLKRAILCPEKDVREAFLENWIDEMSRDPEHIDWPLFFEYLELVQPYPACALDLFRYFVRSPEAMVMALIKSSDDNFEALWSLSSQLPFSWYLVPASAWMTSSRRHFTSLRVALSGIDSADDIIWDVFESFKDRMTVRRPFFRQLCDWLCPAIFPDKQLDNSELSVARTCPDIICNWIQDAEQQFLGRHEADERYPEGPITMRWTEQSGYPDEYTYKNLFDPYRPVRCAPFVAAQICLTGERYDAALLFELKRIRDFDREWFTMAFAFALCLGLSRTPIM